MRGAVRAGAVALLLAGGAALAQTADVPVSYTIKGGDTLLGLARDYMVSQPSYVVVQKMNNVSDPRHIPIGTTLQFPINLLKTEPVLGKVSFFRGDVNVDGKPASLGLTVREGQKVETGANGYVTLVLPDGSSISLPTQSRIAVQRLRRILLTGGVDRSFRLEAGRSRSAVTPFKDGPSGSSFRVTTPLSVSAVRGTDFRVALADDGEKALTEVVGGTVGVAKDMNADETRVPKAFGVAATPAGVQPPVPLLPAPQLAKVERAGTDGATIVSAPVDGAVKYRTQLVSDVRGVNIIDEKVTEQPTATFSLPAGTTFFVRLNAIAASGMEGMPRTYSLGEGGSVSGSTSADKGSVGTIVASRGAGQ